MTKPSSKFDLRLSKTRPVVLQRSHEDLFQVEREGSKGSDGRGRDGSEGLSFEVFEDSLLKPKQQGRKQSRSVKVSPISRRRTTSLLARGKTTRRREEREEGCFVLFTHIKNHRLRPTHNPRQTRRMTNLFLILRQLPKRPQVQLKHIEPQTPHSIEQRVEMSIELDPHVPRCSSVRSSGREGSSVEEGWVVGEGDD